MFVSEQLVVVVLCSQETMETYYQIGVLYCNFITVHFCFYPYSYPVAMKGIFHSMDCSTHPNWAIFDKIDHSKQSHMSTADRQRSPNTKMST